MYKSDMPRTTSTGFAMTTMATVLAVIGAQLVHAHWFSFPWTLLGFMLTFPAFTLMHIGADTLVQEEEDESYHHSF